MAGPRARTGTWWGGVALLLALLLPGPRPSLADEAGLRAALADYASGLTQRGHDRLKAYLATNPSDEEVARVVSKTSKSTLDRIARLGADHQTMLQDLLARARLKDRVQECVSLALRWLAAHQSSEGVWEADVHARWCDGTERDLPAGAGTEGKPQYTLGVSALSLLAFLGAGYTHREDHPYAAVLRRGLDALRAVQDADGNVGDRESAHWLYGHAAVTLAFVEAYARARDDDLVDPARRALAFLASAQNPGSGWRYGVRPGDSDSSLTGWAALAFEAAKRVNAADAAAGRAPTFPYDPKVEEGIRAWFVRSTDPRTGEGGYMQRGTGSARPADLVDAFPADKTESVTAAGLCARLFLGEDPQKNQTLRMQVARCLARPPVWNANDGSLDFYYWRYATHGLAQVGGEPWRAWRRALVSALAPHQRIDGDVCGVKGSWDPVDVWGPDGGRVYATALATIALARASPVEHAKPEPPLPAAAGAPPK